MPVVCVHATVYVGTISVFDCLIHSALNFISFYPTLLILEQFNGIKYCAFKQNTIPLLLNSVI